MMRRWWIIITIVAFLRKKSKIVWNIRHFFVFLSPQ